MSFALIDPIINNWVKRHKLTLFTAIANDTRPIRLVYLSSEANDVFQIWLDQPRYNIVTIYAACIEGAHEDVFEKQWSVDMLSLDAALEATMQLVIETMKPSRRIFYNCEY